MRCVLYWVRCSASPRRLTSYVEFQGTNSSWTQLRSDRKLLAIVFAAEKFYKYTYACNVLVQSDRKPLGTTFSKPLQTAPKRLRRTLFQLQRYDLHVSYQRGTEMHISDMLSRAYLEGKPSVCALQLQEVEHTDDLSMSPERLEAIKSATLT